MVLYSETADISWHNNTRTWQQRVYGCDYYSFMAKNISKP